MLDLRNYGLKIARDTTTSGYIEWEGNTIIYPTISFSIFDFRSFIYGLTTATRTTLFRDILFENSKYTKESPLRTIPDIPWRKIYDNPLDSSSFSNFLTNPRTIIGLENSDKFLFERIATSPDLASRFTLSGPEFDWNLRRIKTYFSITLLFIERLLVLLYLTGGQPPRAPELLSLRYLNSVRTGTRNIFIENDLVVFVTSYYKGYSISGSTKIIHRYLPREIGELLVYYIWLVVPFLERLSIKLYRKPLSDYLFTNPTRKKGSRTSRIDSDRFRRIFRRETLAGLGTALNPSEYRYISIGISRRFFTKAYQFQPEDLADLEDENDIDLEDDVIDLQAGYSSRTAGLVYGRGLFDKSGEIRALKQRFREASIVSLLYFYYISLI